jgi:chemotaxis protein MotB
MKYLFYIIFSVLLLQACVTGTKFTEVDKERLQYAEELNVLRGENEELSVENTELKAFKNNVEGTMLKVAEDTLKLLNDLSVLENRYKQLEQNYTDLKESQETLLKGSARETKRLLKQLQVSQEDILTRENELIQMAEEVEKKKNSLDNLRYELEKRNARLIELEKILYRKDSLVQALRQKVQDALLGFQDEGLTVTQKNGKVYVSLEEKLLFGSGSTEVDIRGKRALEKLAGVLEKNPEIFVMIEGHTDNVPVIPGERMADNWDLSVLRATSIVRIILESSSVDPTRLTVAGRGEFMPLEENTTAEFRQKNRRTEIILTPRLDELFEILDN